MNSFDLDKEATEAGFICIEQDADADRGITLLEKNGRFKFKLQNGNAIQSQQLSPTLNRELQRLALANFQPMTKVTIRVLHEALGLPGLQSALVNIYRCFGRTARCRAVIHSDTPITNWMENRNLVSYLRNNFTEHKRFGLQIVAPSFEVSEDELEEMFALGVAIRIASGWVRQSDGCHAPDIDLGAVRKLAERGFRSVVDWYVHGNNIHTLQQNAESILEAGMYSGFSLPLVSESPYYEFRAGFPDLPSAHDYCQLLVAFYQKYPHFDEVMAPLSELALNVGQGGWNTEFHCHSRINIFVKESGEIGFYRHSPALGQAWTSVDLAASLSNDELRKSLFDFVKETSEWERYAYCRDCRWRWICGGIGVESQSSLAEKHLDAMCMYRKVFIEYFAGERPVNFMCA